jgi:D-alanyl-lipoteichoic acid acyltransferase DltB (MBOAT superfamily)
VQKSVRELLSEFKHTDLGYLPSGISFYNLIKTKYTISTKKAIEDSENEIHNINEIENSSDSRENKIKRIKNLFNGDDMLDMNALVAILMSIPNADILALQRYF